jgi:3-hydroxyacyl-[acyl-carrier-protein] dehydratase
MVAGYPAVLVNGALRSSRVFPEPSQPSRPDEASDASSDPAIARLPHRPPFRFVDAVDELVAGERAVARWRITGDEAWLAGHFPGNPIVPGVLQLEALAQTGALAVLADDRYADKLPLFGGVEEVRWRRLVRPGDELVMAVELERLSARGGWGRARAAVDGQETCRARLLFVIA